jgi:hypothetical protein
MTNVEALSQGCKGDDCRGEEHDVQLVWSVLSGKTRVYWNKRNISRLFQDGNRSPTVEFAWKSRTGEDLKIVAHSEARPGVVQYDLVVNGTSFFKLPNVSELGLSQPIEPFDEPDSFSPEVRQRLDSFSVFSALSDLPSGDHMLEEGSPEALGFRLAMVGLNSGLEEEIVDELHSDLYSPVLESLRYQITECLPQTEEMVSRAIINAFFCDSDSLQSCDSSLSDGIAELDPYQIEANAVWEAYEWVGFNVEYAPRPDAQELALSFMQKQIDEIFLLIRNDKLSSDAASRILLSVGAVLGLKFANSIPMDTIILDGIPGDTTSEELNRILSSYGQLVCTAVVKGPGFALCRFLDEDATVRVLEDAHQDCLVIAGVTPNVIALSEDSHESLPQQLRSRFEEKDDEPASSAHVIFGSPLTIPHLMAPLSTELCCFEDTTEPSYMTPDHCSNHCSHLSPLSMHKDFDDSLEPAYITPPGYSRNHKMFQQTPAHISCSSTSSVTSDHDVVTTLSPDMVSKIVNEQIDPIKPLYDTLYPNIFES